MRRGAYFWGLIFILVGGLLLLQNMELLKIDVWKLLWPLFLIAAGVWVLLGFFFRKTPETEHASVALEGATLARVHIRHGAGRLTIQGSAAPGNLVEGDFGGGLVLDTRRSGDQLEVTLRMPSQAFPTWGPGYSLDWILNLAQDVPLELDVEGGANEAHLYLTDLKVTRLNLKTGASSTELLLPTNAGLTQVDCRAGVSSLTVRVPDGVGARIHARGGLASVNVDTGRFPRAGAYYQSADFETAANKAELTIETGIGSVNVR